MEVVLGGLITILTAILVEVLRRPRLRLQIDQPYDGTYAGAPATEVRFLRILIENRGLPWFARWMSRLTASSSVATISFHHLDGQSVFGRTMTGRWSGAPEPVPSIVVIGGQHGQILDLSRVSEVCHIDIPVGHSERLDIVAKFDQDNECYGWNNESYFSQPPWRNPRWRLPRGRYLVRVAVRSLGERKESLFRLVADMPKNDFRLEPAMEGDIVRD